MNRSHLTGLDSVLLFVKDVDQSRRWYQEVLGVAPSVSIPNFVEFRVGRSALGLHPADEKSPLTTGGQVAYWAVEDFQTAVDHFTNHGAHVYRGPLEIEDGRSFWKRHRTDWKENESMMPHDDSLLHTIVENLKTEHGCHTVILYGSRARGEETPSSDYDILGKLYAKVMES